MKTPLQPNIPDRVEQYLAKTGQTLQELFGGAFSYGLSFILDELVPMALQQNKKIVWHDPPDVYDGTFYTLEDL